MSIKLLDCTLRDGGYQNEWRFGNNNIRNILYLLTTANIDIIECGFLTQEVIYDKETSKFNTIEQIIDVLPESTSMYVAMINYGEFDPSSLPICRNILNGLRITFHKSDLILALKSCKIIKKKGYKVFIQAMVTLNYSDLEFLDLIEKVNDIEPFAFYIVDSFGSLKKKDLMRFFSLAENNLKQDICIGFHSHNNLQLAYSNALMLSELQTNHELIIDASVYGMGRGSGNLNIELFAEHLNENFSGRYKIKPLLNIIDEVLGNFYKQNYWGYSLPNYISAKYNVHPNYANLLDDRNILTYEMFDDIVSMIEENKKYNYDKYYIEKLYEKYMSRNVINDNNIKQLKNIITGNPILIICPGKSVKTERNKIIELLKQRITSISVNFNFENTDYIFISNNKRFKKLSKDLYFKSIVTSNISVDGVFVQPQYSDLLNEIASVRDNAGLMLIKFLIMLGAKKIHLAGMDGYSYDNEQNYSNQVINIIIKNAVIDAMNEGIAKVLAQFFKIINIEFVTKSMFSSAIDVR